MPSSPLPHCLLAAVLTLGCGSGGAAPPTPHPDAGPAAGPAGPPPIMAANEQWTWAPIDGAFCGDGSPTGVAVNLTDRGPNAVIFLMGGGACWDYDTCYVSQNASYLTTGFHESDMPFLQVVTAAVGLLNRDDATNPFRNDSVIAVPYCTGDAFTGSHTAVYQGMSTMHVGHANVMASLARIVPTFPQASRVVLVGVSAGGIGAAFNWWHVQQAFGSKVTVDMLDDSGPALPAPYLSSTLVAQWQASWDFEQGLPPGCTECKTALDALVTYSATQMPNDRGALLGYTQDDVLPGFLSLTELQFTQGLDALATQRLDPLPNARYFFVGASGHVMMPFPSTTQNGVNLWDWIRAMFDGDPAWVDVHP